jgi:Ca2+-binding RTX toxin-like protein
LSSGGANIMVGLAGDDLYYVNNSGDTVTETGGAGYDIVVAGANYALPAEVEALYMNGTGLTGTGSGSADTLLSTGGANILVGLGGDDLYYVNSIGDVVIEGGGGGIDTVIASSSYIMPSEVESLYLVGSGLTGTGNGGDNILLSTGGANNLAGLAGNDLYYVNNSADTVTEAAADGLDTVLTTVNYVLPVNVEALFMRGTGLTGTGNDGHNVLLDVGGANVLFGGAGNDTFAFSSGNAQGDTVIDFDGQGAAPGDQFLFTGFGTAALGASFTQIGATNQWQIHSGLDLHNETITLANGALVQAGDFTFV